MLSIVEPVTQFLCIPLPYTILQRRTNEMSGVSVFTRCVVWVEYE